MAKKKIVQKLAQTIANSKTVRDAANVLKGAQSAGNIIGRGVQKVAGTIAKHPKISTRVAGAATAVSGIKDIKAYKNTRDTGTLIKGIGKTIIGAGLTIFNDKSWYTKHQDIKPAYNDDRPMDPIYSAYFNPDPTMGGVGKLMDLYVDWKGLRNSLVFSNATVKMMDRVRETLKSNLIYGVKDIGDYLLDSIAITILMSQMSRQLTYYRYTPQEFPAFYKLWNKININVAGYGPVSLNELSHYADDSEVATTIAVYDTLVESLQNHIILPPDLAKFIGYYFANLFVTDKDDSNRQYLAIRMNEIDTTLMSNDGTISSINISNLNPSDYSTMINKFITKYAVIAADYRKAELGTHVNFQYFKELQNSINLVYSVDVLQAVINAYTSDSAVNDNYIRLDNMPECVDDLTTYLFMGAVQDKQDPLYTPAFTPLGMLFKIESNNTLNWEDDLKQGDFDFSSDFGFAISTDIYVDVVTSVNTDTTVTFDNNTAVSKALDNIGINYSSTSTSLPVTAYNYPSEVPNMRILKTATGTHYIHIKAMTVYINNVQSNVWAVFSLDPADLPTEPTFIGYYSNQLHNNDEYYITTELDGTALPSQFNEKFSVATAMWESPSGNYHTPEDEATIYNMFDNVTADVAEMGFNATASDVVNIVPNSKIFPTNYFSINNLVGTSSIDTDSYSSSIGMSNYAGYLAQQFDYHLPMLNTVRINVNINGANNQVTVGKSLFKESYIPYWYNIKDLSSVLYSMYTSLFLI